MELHIASKNGFNFFAAETYQVPLLADYRNKRGKDHVNKYGTLTFNKDVTSVLKEEDIKGFIKDTLSRKQQPKINSKRP